MPTLPLALRQWLADAGLSLRCLSYRLGDAEQAASLAKAIPLPPSLLRSVPKRQIEYLAGRACAIAAGASLLGEAVEPPSPGPDRLPCWPSGLTGSITHGGGLAAALVGHAAKWSGLGVDLEPWLTTERAGRLAERIAEPRELDSLRAAGMSHAVRVTLAFCAKEACFKAIYPQARCFFECRDVRLSVDDAEPQRLVATLLRPLGHDWPTGRRVSIRQATVAGSHALSLCAIARDQRLK